MYFSFGRNKNKSKSDCIFRKNKPEKSKEQGQRIGAPDFKTTQAEWGKQNGIEEKVDAEVSNKAHMQMWSAAF